MDITLGSSSKLPAYLQRNSFIGRELNMVVLTGAGPLECPIEGVFSTGFQVGRSRVKKPRPA